MDTEPGEGPYENEGVDDVLDDQEPPDNLITEQCRYLQWGWG